MHDEALEMKTMQQSYLGTGPRLILGMKFFLAPFSLRIGTKKGSFWSQISSPSFKVLNSYCYQIHSYSIYCYHEITWSWEGTPRSRSHLVFAKRLPPNPIVKFQGVPLKATPSFVLAMSRDLEKERPDRDRMWFFQRKYPLILLWNFKGDLPKPLLPLFWLCHVIMRRNAQIEIACGFYKENTP